MFKIYVLKFRPPKKESETKELTEKEILIRQLTEKEFAYTSIAALYAEHSYEVLHVTANHLSRKVSQNGYYFNDFITVKRLICKRKSDILKAKIENP